MSLPAILKCSTSAGISSAETVLASLDPSKRTLLRVEIDEINADDTRKAVDNLMGTKAEARFQFIQERAEFVEDLDI